MKTLIVEDDFTSRIILQEFLREYGRPDVATDGREAVYAVQDALEKDVPYDLICLDIMMPHMDGHEALKKIRALEEAQGILSSDGMKIVMTTALGDIENVGDAYAGLCDAYLVKPIVKEKLKEELRNLGLIED